MAKLSVLLLRLLVLVIFFTPSLSCPEYQKQALLDFKASLFNAIDNSSLLETPFVDIESWSPRIDCCHWDWVHCNSHFGSRTVTALYLTSIIWSDQVVLCPIILTQLFRIRILMHLDVAGNNIEGELPGESLANLTKLVYLDLGGNHFNCSIPSQLFQLTHLQNLDTSVNSFHGILSGEVGSLQNMRELYLEGNFFYGNIPKEIGNMTKLQQLLLYENNFLSEIPSSITNLKELEKIST